MRYQVKGCHHLCLLSRLTAPSLTILINIVEAKEGKWGGAKADKKHVRILYSALFTRAQSHSQVYKVHFLWT